MRPLYFVFPVARFGAVQPAVPVPGPTAFGQKLHVDPANPTGHEPPGASTADPLYQATIVDKVMNFGVPGVAIVLLALAPIRPFLIKSVVFEGPVARMELSSFTSPAP